MCEKRVWMSDNSCDLSHFNSKSSDPKPPNSTATVQCPHDSVWLSKYFSWPRQLQFPSEALAASRGTFWRAAGSESVQAGELIKRTVHSSADSSHSVIMQPHLHTPTDWSDITRELIEKRGGEFDLSVNKTVVSVAKPWVLWILSMHCTECLKKVNQSGRPTCYMDTHMWIHRYTLKRWM